MASHTNDLDNDNKTILEEKSTTITGATSSSLKSCPQSPISSTPVTNSPIVPRIGEFTSQTINYPSKDGTYLKQFCNQPLVTTLSSFSHVANLVRNPYELINNVDEMVKQARGNQNQFLANMNSNRISRNNDKFVRMLNQNQKQSTPTSPISQEMDTFVNYQNQSVASTSSEVKQDSPEDLSNTIPIPALPPLESSMKRGRSEPMTIDEYETMRNSVSDDEIFQRVFYGGFANNQLRAALWPYLLGLVKHRGKFNKLIGPDGQTIHLFIDNEQNTSTWAELEKLYHVYRNQWQAVLPDQEIRFSTFRERKSLIERDVIRCDRLHPFYADDSPNLGKLNELLMTYMMYDFDIGYVQGMSDLAGPILWSYNGDLVKSFWIFVEVMKLVRRNFELSQKTVQFQLSCLSELVKATDPIFHQYLREHESENCFFAFRAIVCLFKRELMKDDEANYNNVLTLWDSIWIVHRIMISNKPSKKEAIIDSLAMPMDSTDDHASINDVTDSKLPTQTEANVYALTVDINQADSGRYYLTDTEIFVLSLCLSMIRRERDLVLANQLDATDIHLHFIDPKLSEGLRSFLEHAINIYNYLKCDFDLDEIIIENHKTNNVQDNSNDLVTQSDNPQSPNGSTEGYDLLNDFLIINGASGT